MSWKAFTVQTMTGVVGDELPVSSEGSWTIPLNGVEEWSLTVPRSVLRELDPKWWAPWKASVLVCWESPRLGRVPWLLGPLVSPVAEDLASDSATLSCRGLGALLERRVVLARDYGRQDVLPSAAEMQLLAKSVASLENRSLGTIAQDVVTLSTNDKTGGQLPIKFVSPRETGSGLNQRNYEGWNLANNGTWKRLEELTNVIGGPDIAFRPAWANAEETMVRWDMHHGTRAQPTIPQREVLYLDATAHDSPVANVSVKSTADSLVNRVYWTGAGEGAGTLVRMAQDVSRLADHMPLLEHVGSTSDSENASLVQQHAMSALADGIDPLLQLSVDIDGGDEDAEIGRWHVGDTAVVHLQGWLTVPDGALERRIISAKGNWGNSVTLEFQEDEYGSEA